MKTAMISLTDLFLRCFKGLRDKNSLALSDMEIAQPHKLPNSGNIMKKSVSFSQLKVERFCFLMIDYKYVSKVRPSPFQSRLTRIFQKKNVIS
jgi:hypothetical protein